MSSSPLWTRILAIVGFSPTLKLQIDESCCLTYRWDLESLHGPYRARFRCRAKAYLEFEVAMVLIAIDVSIAVACVGAAVGPTVISEREKSVSFLMLTGRGYK